MTASETGVGVADKDGPIAVDTIVPALVLLLPLVYSTELHHSFFAPKMALVLALAGFGIPFVFSEAISRTEKAAAVGFLLWASLALALNDQPGLSLWGHSNWGTGWLFMAGLVGAWAAGRHLSDLGRKRLRAAIVIAALATTAFAVAEVRFDLRAHGLPLVGGRPIGLVGNPVHVGGLTAASVALLPLGRGRRALPAAGAAFALGIGLGLSGSRAGTAAAVVAAAYLLVKHRSRAVVLVVAVAVGVIISPLLAASEYSVARRLTSDGALDASARPYAWREAVKGIESRPLFGSGPGRFQEGTTEFRTVEHARLAPDRYFEDAHNLPLEYMVTVGLPGALLAAAWVVVAGKKAGGPLLWFAIALVPFALLQPQTAGLTPIAFAALGAAGQRRVPSPNSAIRMGSVLGGLGGAVAGVILILGSRAAFLTRTEFRYDDAERAYALLPPWPEAALYRAAPDAFRSGKDNPRAVQEGIKWYRRAAERNPLDARNWIRVADYEINFGRLDAAEAHYRVALAVDPASVRARKGLGLVAGERGDLDAGQELFEQVLDIRPNDRLARQQLRAIAREREEAGP